MIQPLPILLFTLRHDLGVLLLTTPRPSCEVGESSAAAAARQSGPTMAHRVDHSLVDTMETRFRDTERRMVTALEMVNMRVSYQVDVRSRESSKFYTRHHDAQKDRAAVRAEIEHVMQPEMGMIAILQERGARMHVEVARDAPSGLPKMPTFGLQGHWGSCWTHSVEMLLHGGTLTTTPEAAHAMPWRTLKKMMTDKYCPMGKIKKLGFEMWNLKVKGTDVVTYSQRFQELALMCNRMFPEEIDQVEKYVSGLPDTIHGSVMTTKPKTMQDAIEFATEL
ncbi:reverse transcriptase domain-containing protein, partial [Tanacetum coccineum]